MRKRVGAIIIQNKKLLMLTHARVNLYWTPGGKLDNQETYKAALKRELQEELHVTPRDMRFYCKFKALNGRTLTPSEDEYFVVDTNDTIKIGAEIEEAVWASRDELEKLPILDELKENVIDKLIQDDLI